MDASSSSSRAPSIEHPLRGVIPPLVTPLGGADELDVDCLERLIEHVLAGGVHGLFILGTTGEGPSLSNRLRRELVEQTCALTRGRVPVLVGVTDSSAADTERLARHAADAGASAVVLAPPFYFPIGDDDLLAYFRDIVPRLPLPTYLYNMPTHTKVPFTADLVRRMTSCDNVVGMKDSAPGATCFREVRDFVLRERPDFALLIGPEELMSECVMRGGAHGGVCGGANVFPRLFVELYDASSAGDETRAAALQALVVRLAKTVYAAGNGNGYAAIQSIKRALSRLGVCGDQLAPPMRPLEADQERKVDRATDVLARQLKDAIQHNPIDGSNEPAVEEDEDDEPAAEEAAR